MGKGYGQDSTSWKGWKFLTTYQRGYLSQNVQNPSMVIIKSGDIAGGYLA